MIVEVSICRLAQLGLLCHQSGNVDLALLPSGGLAFPRTPKSVNRNKDAPVAASLLKTRKVSLRRIRQKCHIDASPHVWECRVVT